jgi:hypothetical protein
MVMFFTKGQKGEWLVERWLKSKGWQFTYGSPFGFEEEGTDFF